jgi:pimeloyl-ACP methyl ester carboxylesterase
MRAWCGRAFAASVWLLLGASHAQAQVATHPSIRGESLSALDVEYGRRSAPAVWDELSRAPRAPGLYVLHLHPTGGDAVEVPMCAGRRHVLLDGAPVAPPAEGLGPFLVRLPDRSAPHDLAIEVNVSGYERRIACGAAPRMGTVAASREGLGVISFASPHSARGGGRAVVFVPHGHDATKPAALLVGAHPWDGTIWTYAAYAELLREADDKDVVLLVPSGLGNSLYTAAAEVEVLRATDALSMQLAVDPRRVSIFGASMGGAGATTVGLHHPDRFATITSFFGDSRYDISTYVQTILRDETAAHAVNAFDVVDNARHVPVWLVHGEEDAVSPITQSSMLARALTERKYAVRFDRIPGAGHEGALVARFAAEIVDKAAEARSPEHPSRVTFKSVRLEDTGAYGVHIVRSGGDALIDVERRGETVHVLRATGVKSIQFERGALGASAELPLVFEAGVPTVEARWATPDGGAARPLEVPAPPP